MSRIRGEILILILAVLTVAGPFRPAAFAQQKQPDPVDLAKKDKPQGSDLSEAISLPTDRQIKKRLEAAEDDYIPHEQWPDAANLLQSVLDNKEDVFVQVKRSGPGPQEKVHWASAKAEANRLIGTMGAKGLEFYELRYGAPAKALLAEGKKTGDPQTLALVAHRFFHTEAGAEATDLLGTYALDRGDALMAALWYKRLLGRQGAEQLLPLTLFKAALAFRLSGDIAYRTAAESTWKQLMSKVGREGLRLEDENVSLDSLKQELERARVGENVNLYDWPLFRGNASRSAKGRGGAPFLESKWQKSTLPEESHTLGSSSVTKGWVEKALQQPYRPEYMLPAFFPVAVNGKLIYRSYSAVHAVDIKTGELAWNSVDMTASLDKLGSDNDTRQEVQNWFDQYVRGMIQNIIFENSTNGTLSSDGTRVYAIDDLAIPPHPAVVSQGGMAWNNGIQITAKLKQKAERSRLIAIDLESGLLRWEAGDPGHCPPELQDHAFLGPPLPLGGKLYVLSEKAKDLNLLCLDAAKGTLIWTQRLATVQNPLIQDILRRVQAVHLAYGEGILVCPTNAGAVLGVDLLSHSLVWAYPYREKSPDQPAPAFPMGGRGRGRFAVQMGGPDAFVNLQKSINDWKCSAPIIQDGKVVFTAWDGSSIHCVNLHDGNSIWQAERRDDLYMAGVFQGKVVLVGKNTCRALSLADGKQQLWQVETGLPSGQGAASGSYYFLPLKKGEVCQIDMEKGQVVARSASPKNEIPGNLLFYEGEVISQTETEVTCYPQVEYKVAQITDLLRKNPKDPNALTERGELRLYKGDLAGAVADLRQAVNSRPSGLTFPKARAKLYATLTELLQRDFNAAEKYLDEYKELCKIEIPSDAAAAEKQKLEEERHRRQSGYLYLLAEGRVKQGRLMEAFQAYLDFGALAGNNELVSVINEPAVKARPDVWARGRIAALVAKASPQQRQELESEIAKRWKAVQDSKDLESLRRFVAAFGSVFAVGREARLRLAERLIEENSPLEAEGHLLQLRQQDQDPQIAGRAVEALARLMTRKGLLEDAAYYYRILRRDFAKTLIRQGKTGAEIFDDLGTDKRFLPYLEEVAAPLMSGSLKVAEIKSGRSANPQPWVFEPRGELTPFFEHHRLVWGTVHMNNMPRFQLDLVADDGSHDEWSLSSTTRVPYDWSSMNTVRVPCFVKGHLAVLYLGHTLYGIDFIERRKLWERDLLVRDQQRLENLAQQALMFRMDGEGGLYLITGQGSQQKLGQIGALTKSYLCLRTPEGLEAVDPLHGTILWRKADVSAHTQIFGDDDYLYLAEVRDDRSVGATRVIRGSDGAAVDVPDFSVSYQHRQRILGGRLLVSESGPSGGTLLRLYDVRTGKDVWKKDLPAGSLVLRVEEPALAATITLDGKLSVVDLQTKHELLEANVKLEHLDKVTEGLLLRDSLQYYVALNNGSERNANLQGPTPNLSALSSALVNKAIYAFRWDDSKAKWRLSWYFDELPNQAMLLERFKDLPMIFLSSRYDEVVKDAGLGAVRKVVATISIEKRTGKRVWNEKPLGGPPVTGPFHTLEIDHQTAQVQLIGDRVRLVHYVGDALPKQALAPRASRSQVWDDEWAGQVAPVPARRPMVRNAPP